MTDLQNGPKNLGQGGPSLCDPSICQAMAEVQRPEIPWAVKFRMCPWPKWGGPSIYSPKDTADKNPKVLMQIQVCNQVAEELEINLVPSNHATLDMVLSFLSQLLAPSLMQRLLGEQRGEALLVKSNLRIYHLGRSQ